MPWIDLKRQYAGVKGEVEAAIQRVLDSGWFVSASENEGFEQEWAAYCGTLHAVALASGTDALNLTLKALGIGPGDEVITVAFTVSATLDAIHDLGAKPVLIDVDPVTYTLDPSQIAAKLSPHTKAILPVHVYGHPVDLDSILAAAGDIPVVLDACEAHGALYKGVQASTHGVATCYSFYPTKNLGALGDAGAVVTNDNALAERLRLLRQHGWDRRYHSVTPSLNSRMDEIQAAILRAKLPYLDDWNDRRRAIARRFDEAISGTKLTPAPNGPWADPAYYFYVVLTPQRDAFRGALKDAGIATDVSWPEPPHLQPAYEYLGYGKGSLPVTERLCDQVVTIPMFPDLTDPEIDRICAALRSF
ncbi:MAG: erythromycin biosynthesis sensory transduction protein eryC1 [Dehalococcoidia bacterium]|nr:erythromycin biosynthesis sensory transduction protein eryC1 [Dehalococcoidia bacterium]